MKWIPYLLALRPRQWVKNAAVMAPLFFALGDRNIDIDVQHWVLASVATLLFCLVSSSVYLMNDISDRDRDRMHPTKKLRPIASGSVSIGFARILSALLALGSLSVAALLSLPYAGVLLTYYLMQVAYTYKLKQLAWLDVIIIALGFVFRVLSGALIIAVPISHWLLICTLVLALFLGLCKRRHEKVVLSTIADHHTRPSLAGYTEKGLDIMITLCATTCILAYALYTQAPETVEKMGSRNLIWTLPWVALGIWRYRHLAYTKEQAERPEKVLFTDLPIITVLAGYAMTLLFLFLNP